MISIVDILVILIKVLILVAMIPITLGVVTGWQAARFTGKTSAWQGTIIGLNLGSLAVPINLAIGYLHLGSELIGDGTAWTLGIVLTVALAVAGPIIAVSRRRDRD